MKIANFVLDSVLEFDDTRMLSWIIDNPQKYYEFVKEIQNQTQGEIGNFVISDKEKDLKIESDVQMIIGPFDLSFNSKKITTLIAKRLLKTALENDDAKFKEISQLVNDYISELICDSDLPIEAEELEENELIKTVTVKTKECRSFYDNLVNYVSLILNLMRPKLLILVDIKPYIMEDKFSEFIQFLMYEDINVFFVDLKMGNEKCKTKTYFLDSDNCEFEYKTGDNIDI